ncbi:transcriptional regulator [Halorussus salinus]|uniref:transcriptional regulator n=1 Tax=Halorussus salinus TaxID=1364935 RepID=UPI0010920185|nr:transcriptional regulator [Halorussus salinus]
MVNLDPHPSNRDEQPSEEDFASAVEYLDTATTTVAERVGCGYDSAYYYLNKLEEDGVVRSEKIGNSLVWHAD